MYVSDDDIAETRTVWILLTPLSMPQRVDNCPLLIDTFLQSNIHATRDTGAFN